MKRERLNTADFNSHAHVERDLKAVADTLQGKDFNSHAHVERDPIDKDLFCLLHISTHTLTWSVTYCPYFAEMGLGISTHTLTWSVTAVYLYDE